MEHAIKPYFALGAVVVLVGLVPLALRRDSFPLSTYPMFSSNRKTTERVETAVFVGGDGRVTRLDPQTIAGTDEVILAARTVSRAIEDRTTELLCREIADRFASVQNGRIEIVGEVFDSLKWYQGDKTPVRRDTIQTCSAKSP